MLLIITTARCLSQTFECVHVIRCTRESQGKLLNLHSNGILNVIIGKITDNVNVKHKEIELIKVIINLTN